MLIISDCDKGQYGPDYKERVTALGAIIMEHTILTMGHVSAKLVGLENV